MGDGGRWLTAKGRKTTRKVARWLAKSNKRRPSTLWTSPLVRAVQTAEILAAAADIKGEIPSCAQLGPGHDPGDLLKLLASAGATVEGPLALVGHEPALSLIATALLGDIGFAGFKKSGVLGLTWTPPPAPPASTNGNGGAAPGSVGELWFVLDPARMKSQKRIVPRPAPRRRRPAEPATES